MGWYYYIAWFAIIGQMAFIAQMFRNYRYSLAGPRDKGYPFSPKTMLTIPCKGIDPAFEKNISSFFKLDYQNYILRFVVQDTDDPAYEKLCQLSQKLALQSKALDVEILVAGLAVECSQKIHNLLYSYHCMPEDVEILAFADSDVCVRCDWLRGLVRPLRKRRTGATSGYRWFVPQKNNLATLALSALNAKITQLLGAYRFNQAWGGSMAIRADVFRRIGLEEIWPKAISDDLSLSYAVKKAKMKVVFVPACMVASYEATTWPKLFEFARRQFLITRVSAPGTWWFGLVGSLCSILGLWAGSVIAVYAIANKHPHWILFTAVPTLFFAGNLVRSLLRQSMIRKLLKPDIANMKFAKLADVLGSCIWSWVMLGCIIASGFGRTIKWRGIRYKLLGPTDTVIVK